MSYTKLSTEEPEQGGEEGEESLADKLKVDNEETRTLKVIQFQQSVTIYGHLVPAVSDHIIYDHLVSAVSDHIWSQSAVYIMYYPRVYCTVELRLC